MASGKQDLRQRPRAAVERLILARDWEGLLLRAGELHGHYCPFLALGVRAGGEALLELGLDSDGMEDLVAVVETNGCFSDGIQCATGCTFGNNALVFKDVGKTAVTVVRRGGRGLRLRLRDVENFVAEHSPEAAELFEKVVVRREGSDEDREALKKAWTEISFKVVNLPAETLFEAERDVGVALPEYAPIYESRTCARCGERVMAPRTVAGPQGDLCLTCAGAPYFQLDGKGMTCVASR
ncbi:MAG TPA: formylmethanofuran dehydrogenase [Clostridiales bacterium]|nr:formylmethanofuran dehydrogenase [Clostridiales bacterium]